MGLDSFWEMPGGKEQLKFDPPLTLCGGIFSENGAGSFRGKVYDNIIEEATGQSLYEERIENDVVAQMAGCMDAVAFASLEYGVDDGDDGASYDGFRTPAKEWADLVRMFRAYADAGASLRGWW